MMSCGRGDVSMIQNRVRGVVALLLAGLGCADGAKIMPSSSNESESQRGRYPVEMVSAARVEGLSDEALEAEQRALIEAILQQVPPERRAVVRQFFERTPSAMGAFTSSTDPEIARLLGGLNAIGAEMARRQFRGSPSSSDLESGADDRRIIVVVALAPRLEQPNIRATVIRQPGDGGRPIVLLREGDVNTTDLMLAMRAAAESFRKHGVVPEKEVRTNLTSLRRGVGPSPRTPLSGRYLEMLRASPLRNLPGIGLVRAMEMTTKVNPD